MNYNFSTTYDMFSTKELNSISSLRKVGNRLICLLPKNMSPNKSVFENLGFEFKEYDSVTLEATLPEGWTILSSENGLETLLIDEKGRNRGSFFFRGNVLSRTGYMLLVQRYHATYYFINPNKIGPIKVVATDFDGTVIFKAGYCMNSYSNEYEHLLTKAKDFLNKNFPNWKNPINYWD